MSVNASYLRDIDVESSVISGLIVLLFDIVLLGIIKAEIQVLCTTANLSLIYDRRSTVSPTTSRIGCLTGSPIGQKRLVRWFSVIIIAVTFSVIVLGFSVDGKTSKKFEEQRYSSMVFRASEPPFLDFENEFSLSANGDRRISRRVSAIMAIHACSRSNFTHLTEYAYAYRDLSVDKTRINASTVLHSDCITKDQFKYERILNVGPMLSSTSPFECEFNDLKPSFEDNSVTGYATFSPSSQCDLKISRLSCFRTGGTTSCAGAGVREEDGNNKAYIVVLPDIEDPGSASVAQISLVDNENLYERIASNVALYSFLMGGGAAAYYFSEIVFSDIIHNVTLERSIGSHEVSEIDLRLAIPTVIFICIIAIVLGASAFVFWFKVVYLKGRLHYNSFCTVPEVLTLADDANETKLKENSHKRRYIGIRQDMPVLGIMGAHKCCNADWDENEIG